MKAPPLVPDGNAALHYQIVAMYRHAIKPREQVIGGWNSSRPRLMRI
jgi:hypothetical protein